MKQMNKKKKKKRTNMSYVLKTIRIILFHTFGGIRNLEV